MKKPSQKLIDAFFKWYEIDPHAGNEDYYREAITLDHLSGLSRADFIKFFQKFAYEGGKVQSGGYRTSGKFKKTIESNYEKFHAFVLKPFETDFDEEKWLAGIKAFRYFGVGLATIYLNRIDKKRFAILNNKAVDSLALFGLSFPTNTIKRYQIVRDAQQQLITWFPLFDNFYRTDALAQFLIGEKAGRPWKDLLESDSGSADEDTGEGRHSIWKISHGKADFSAKRPLGCFSRIVQVALDNGSFDSPESTVRQPLVDHSPDCIANPIVPPFVDRHGVPAAGHIGWRKAIWSRPPAGNDPAGGVSAVALMQSEGVFRGGKVGAYIEQLTPEPPRFLGPGPAGEFQPRARCRLAFFYLHTQPGAHDFFRLT